VPTCRDVGRAESKVKKLNGKKYGGQGSVACEMRKDSRGEKISRGWLWSGDSYP